MTKFSLIRPLDQPIGTRRLLNDLEVCLSSELYSDFRIIVAYAKSGTLIRLEQKMKKWKSMGKKSSAIFGIDQKGTSKEALEISLHLFDEVFITQELGITFHPKMYLFIGAKNARAFIGSNNLTVGGTEKNFESAVDLELVLPDDYNDLSNLETAWEELLPSACIATKKLDEALILQLHTTGHIVNEKEMYKSGNISSNSTLLGMKFDSSRERLVVKPESALPKGFSEILHNITNKITTTTPTTIGKIKGSQSVRGFAIQIKPHHNGEIFLSVTATLQNPAFFKWPFTGKTTPKKTGNPSYPQLDPDPVIDLIVRGAPAKPILSLNKYSLNTVFYETKKEIRITAAPLVGVVPEYSIMVMEESQDPNIDYNITIFTPDSPEYIYWELACNQVMPGGGKKPRKFGWF